MPKLVSGFTLIEMMVVAAIIIVVTAVVFSGQGSFNNSIQLTNTAYDVALSLHDAETYGLGTRAIGGISNAGYGVDFKKGTPGSYTLFADTSPAPSVSNCHGLPANGASAPDAYPGDCVYGSGDAAVANYTLGNNLVFSDFCAYNGSWSCATSGSASLSQLDITFSRPNSTPFFSVNGAYASDPMVTSACLKVAAPKGASKYVNVYQGGQIELASGCSAVGGGIGGGDSEPPTPPPAPTCTFTPSVQTIAPGDTATISWVSTDATSASISPDVGPVPTSGSTSVSPSVTTTYTETVTGSATGQCQTTVTVAVATQQVIFLTASFGTYTVPPDWNNLNNTIEVIGGGGGGNGTIITGAGGGAYSKSTNVTLSQNAQVRYWTGLGGSNASDGGDTFFCNSTSNCSNISGSAVVVGAKGGKTGSNGGAGGAAAAGVGNVKYSGGNGGGGSSPSTSGGGGGGGAAGPFGPGANGGTVSSGAAGGGGGGGADGGTVGASVTGAQTSGGAGGKGPTGTGGGAGGVVNTKGGNGSLGGGGGGGAGSWNSSTGSCGGIGGGGTEWDSSHGAGGGGGGAPTLGSYLYTSGCGYNPIGGWYGGGGGAGYSGENGIIVVTYTPGGGSHPPVSP